MRNIKIFKCFLREAKKASLTFGEAKNFTKAKPSFHPLEADFTRNIVSDFIANVKRLQTCDN